MATSITKSKAAPRKATASKTPTKATPDTKVKTASTLKPATPKLAGTNELIVSEPELKKKELIDLVVERSKIKKKDAKPVIEAMLAVLGETIASGRELNLQPLGKLRINRSTDKGNGRVIICKLRQSTASGNPNKNALAAPEDTL